MAVKAVHCVVSELKIKLILQTSVHSGLCWIRFPLNLDAVTLPWELVTA